MHPDPKANKTMGSRGLFSVLLLGFILTGCSSDDSESNGNQETEYYFRFKADGTQVEYEYEPKTQINLTGSILFDGSTNSNSANITGIENIFDSEIKDRLTIFISDSDDIATGITYTNIIGEGDVTPSSSFLMGYYDGQGNLYAAGLNTGTAELYELATVTLTEITEIEITGTFSGTFLWYDVGGGTVQLVDSMVISGGMFAVPRF